MTDDWEELIALSSAELLETDAELKHLYVKAHDRALVWINEGYEPTTIAMALLIAAERIARQYRLEGWDKLTT